MRLGGRLAAAIEVLQDIEDRNRPAADSMRDWGLSHRFAGSGDRAAIGNLVYDALRRKHAAAWLFDAETPRALVFGSYLLEYGLSAEALDASLAGDNFAPPPLDEGERNVLSARSSLPLPNEARANVPDWCLPLVKQSFGDDWVEECAELCSRPPLDLRVNTLKARREKVLESLSRHEAQATRVAPHGIRIPAISADGRHPNVQNSPAFQEGWFEVQDEGSQIVAELAGAEAGMQVLDFCAGAGGKTLACSARMENQGQVFAFDADRQRLEPIHDRLKRAGSRNVQVVGDLSKLASLEGQLDLVIVDAPCTGSGTWRRRPDAKWRLSTHQLETRMAEQRAILANAARYVKNGGRLAYITCSIFEEENGRQVRDFLNRTSNFQRMDHHAVWQERFNIPTDAVRIDPAGGITLSPAKTGTDGFFFAMLEKSGN